MQPGVEVTVLCGAVDLLVEQLVGEAREALAADLFVLVREEPRAVVGPQPVTVEGGDQLGLRLRFSGLLGWARVVEITDADNGGHVRIHALLCFGGQVSAELVAASVGARMFSRWRAALERRGFVASDEHGWDLRRVQLGDGDLADYFTKVAHEVTSSHRREGRRPGGRAPMQPLADAVDTYEKSAIARWWEWEQASEGRRQLTWSVGTRSLRRFAELDAEASDEDVAAEDLGGDGRLWLSFETWEFLHVNRRQTELLDTADAGGVVAARSWLTSLGLH